MRHQLCPASCLLAFSFTCTSAFYLPGVAPKEYLDGDAVDLKVNKLTSVKTQLPYKYYQLPFCQPQAILDSVENLGEILAGDAIETSPYNISMNVNESCKFLCKVILDDEKKAQFQRFIDNEYVVNWIIDNLPAAQRYYRVQSDGHGGQQLVDPGAPPIYKNGFPVGELRDGKYILNNHIRMHLMWHQNKQEFEGYRIVGFEVEALSMVQSTRDEDDGLTVWCDGDRSRGLNVVTHKEVIFTYDVVWTESPIRWASRWDNYLRMEGGQIHWLSIVNSLLVTLFLTGMVAMILLRTLHRDIAKYNELATTEEILEETGWKLVHADVFRKPKLAKLLCVSVGSGVQLLGMSLVTLVFAGLGFLSPARRGGLLQSMMLLFTFMGVLAGYMSSRLYKVLNGEDWKTTTMLTAFLFPGIFFGVFFFLNLFIWGQKSSGAVPFTTMFAVLVLWFGISVPLVFLGAYHGFRKEAMDLPVRTNQIPRQIPAQPWYNLPIPCCLAGGLLPFGAVMTELFFIMGSLWQHQFYYLFGFLVLVVLILIVTCAEISIALTYFQLACEDYNWWWRSFLCSGTSGLYVFMYSVVYFSTRLRIDKVVSTMLYFGYMAILSTCFFLLTGSIGLLATFKFTRAIYASIKVD